MPCFPFKGCSRGHIKSPAPFHLPFAFPALSLWTVFFSLPDNYLHRRRIISSPGNAFLFSAPCPGLPLSSEVVHLEEGHQSCWGGFALRGIFFVWLSSKERQSWLARLCPLTAAISLGLGTLQWPRRGEDNRLLPKYGGCFPTWFQSLFLDHKGYILPSQKTLEPEESVWSGKHKLRCFLWSPGHKLSEADKYTMMGRGGVWGNSEQTCPS